MPDSRITKQALANSLKDLMGGRPFEKITVSDIAAGCGMNRKSFYYHFRDKYELVDWIFLHDFNALFRDRPKGGVMDFFRVLCGYFYENRSFYHKALAIKGQNSFSNCIHDKIQPIVLEFFRSLLSEEDDYEFLSGFYTDAMIAALVRWLNTEPLMEPERLLTLMDRSLNGLANGHLAPEA